MTKPMPASSVNASGAKDMLDGLSVFIRQLEVMAQIGVHPHEHGRTQRVLVDVDLTLDAPAPAGDRLGETVDYQAISHAVEKLARAGHVQLVETLAMHIAQWCLEDDPRVQRVTVRVEKPEALPNARAAGCALTLTRSA